MEVPLSDPRILSFWRKYGPTHKHVTSCCEQLFGALCESMDAMLSKQATSPTEHEIGNLIQTLEQGFSRNEASFKSLLASETQKLEGALSLKLDEHASSTIHELKSTIHQEHTTFLQKYDDTVTSLSHLIESNGASINQHITTSNGTVREMLQSNAITLFESSQKQASDMITQFKLFSDNMRLFEQRIESQLASQPSHTSISSLLEQHKQSHTASYNQLATNISTYVETQIRQLLQQVASSTTSATMADALHPLEERIRSEISALRASMPTTSSDTSVALKHISDNLQSFLSKFQSLECSSSVIHSLSDMTTKEISLIREALASIKTQNDSLDKHITALEAAAAAAASKQSTKTKGTESELMLYTLLTDRLLSRDGYSVEHIAGKSHACDILVSHNEYPDVRIECKSHGEHNGAKVKASEVCKFKRDLQSSNDHGIMISFHSGIAGISSGIDIHQLPTGKFAFFISNSGYDADLVITCLNVIYKLHKWTEMNSSLVSVSSETVSEIKRIVTKETERLNEVKRRLKESLDILGDMSLSSIEALLLGNQMRHKEAPAPNSQPSVSKNSSMQPTTSNREPINITPSTPRKKESVYCPRCGRGFENSRGLAKHAYTCNKTNAR